MFPTCKYYRLTFFQRNFWGFLMCVFGFYAFDELWSPPNVLLTWSNCWVGFGTWLVATLILLWVFWPLWNWLQRLDLFAIWWNCKISLKYFFFVLKIYILLWAKWFNFCTNFEVYFKDYLIFNIFFDRKNFLLKKLIQKS